MYLQLIVQTEPDGEDFKATAHRTDTVSRPEYHGAGFTPRLAAMEAVERLIDAAANEESRGTSH